MMIRNIKVDDAERFLNLSKQLDEETKFMLYEPGERKTTLEAQTERISSILSSNNSMIFVAEADGEIVGYLGAFGSDLNRIKHSVHIVVGILQKYTGQGIGSKLFQELEDWARKQHIHRLELTVMSHNQAAFALYKKVGFEVEGIKKHSLIVDDEYVDEYYMAKLL
ncbi:RimJ/RimL family protein N-acetyltransferase [Paenibacillus sediminis]|uniref:RimJ/RimL family protein N-acetyltransferase n=2 Tax=Paenibacillus sediminis TaxID=664909 RepID=A0ABS4H1Z9_9BACL|nr:RimJ/RimL family protein N-acetyltransferase [Paenibacillus sediminis]